MENRIRLFCKLHHQLWWHQLLHRTWAFNLFRSGRFFANSLQSIVFVVASVLSIPLNAFNFSRLRVPSQHNPPQMLQNDYKFSIWCAFKWNGKLSISLNKSIVWFGATTDKTRSLPLWWWCGVLVSLHSSRQTLSGSITMPASMTSGRGKFNRFMFNCSASNKRISFEISYFHRNFAVISPCSVMLWEHRTTCITSLSVYRSCVTNKCIKMQFNYSIPFTFTDFI